MDKEAKFGVRNVFVGVVLGLVVVLSLVWASTVHLQDADGIVNEDITNYYNISINGTGGDAANISQVNITLPNNNFTFLVNSNETTTLADTFVNTSSVLSWRNATGWVMNGSNNLTFGFNATATWPGYYNFTVTLGNATSSNSFNISVYINDTTAPTSSLVNPTLGGNYSSTLILNVSVVDFAINTVFFNITNSSGKQNATYTASQQGASGYWNASLNTSNFPDGVYNITVWANDSDNHLSNQTIGSNVVFDNTAPSVTIARSSSSTMAQIVIDVTITDGSGIGGSCGLVGYGSGVDVAGSGTNSQTITLGGLSCGASTDYTVSCTDRTGNIGTSAVGTYSTTACSGSDSSPGGSTTTTWTNTFVESDKELSEKESVTKSLGSKQRVKLKVGGKTHYVGVTSVSTDTVTLELTSDPQTATLKVGDERKFDVDGDNVYDVMVKLNAIINNKADIVISATGGAVTAETVAEEAGKEAVAAGETIGGDDEESRGSNLGWIIGIIVVILIVVTVYFVVMNSKKGKKK